MMILDEIIRGIQCGPGPAVFNTSTKTEESLLALPDQQNGVRDQYPENKQPTIDYH